MKFEAGGREFAKILRSLEQFTYSNSERSEQFLVTETCSWRFLRLDKLEQLKSKLEKIIGIEKHAGKVRKVIFSQVIRCFFFITFFYLT